MEFSWDYAGLLWDFQWDDAGLMDLLMGLLSDLFGIMLDSWAFSRD